MKKILCFLMVVLMVFTLGSFLIGGVSADEDGIYHIVRYYDAEGRLLHTEKVADETPAPQPPVPDIPAGMNAFLGWFREGDAADPDGHFRFTTLIFEDLNLYAAFSEEYLVQFENAFGKVVKSVLVAPGGRLAAPADIAVFSPAEGQVFTGGWHVKSADGRDGAAYDFGREVAANFTLVPELADQYLVQFETDGDPVAPQTVERNGTAVKPAGIPTRKGYAFLRWSAEAGGEAYDFTAPVTGDMTIYAVWDAEYVPYKVVYWLEKPDIAIDVMNRDVEASVVDPAKYAFAYSEIKRGEAGTMAAMPEGGVPQSGAFKTALLLAGTNAAAPYARYYKSSPAEVAGDGTTVVNVYYTRRIYTLRYVWSAPANGTVTAKLPGRDSALILENGASYTYEIKAKIGLNLNGVAPKIFSDDGAQQFVRLDGGAEKYLIRGWGPWSLSSFNPFTALYLSVSGDTYANSYNPLTATATYNAKWELASTQNKTIRHVFVESLDQQSTAASAPFAEGALAGRLLVQKLIYLSGAETGIPVGAQYFDLFSTSNYYWATTGDRQIANMYDGFTYYSVEKTGNWSNCYQWEMTPGDGLFYQLKYTGTSNRNDPVRYYFFSRNAYSIVFNNTGHDPIGKVESVKYEAPVAAFEPDADALGLKEKEVFRGWFLDSDCTMPFDFRTQTMPAGDIELFALYEREDHTVTFLDAMGGREILRAGVADGGTVARPGRFEAGGGYESHGTFRGWYWELGGHVVPFNWNTRIRGDVEIFAVWSTDGFAVQYDLDGGDGATPADTHRYEIGSAARAARVSGLTKNGGLLLFAGWQRDELGDILYPGKVFAMYGDTRLTARYVPASATVSVTYCRNRDAGDSQSQQRLHLIGETATLPAGAELGFQYEGRDFRGWSADKTAAAPDEGFRAGDEFTVDGNATLYAVWAGAPEPTTTVAVTHSSSAAAGTSATASAPSSAAATETASSSGAASSSRPDRSTTEDASGADTAASTTKPAATTAAPSAVPDITLYLEKILKDDTGALIGTGLMFQVQVLDSGRNVVATAAVTANGGAVAVTGLASGETYYVREMLGDYFNLAGYDIGNHQLIEKDYLIFRSTLSSVNVAGSIHITLTNVSTEEDIELADPEAPLAWPEIDPGDTDVVEIVPDEVPLGNPDGSPRTGVSFPLVWFAPLLALAAGSLFLLKGRNRRGADKR